MINDIIKQKRIELGISQLAVAKKLKIPSGAQYISNFERGACFLAPKQLKGICNILELDYHKMAYIMTLELSERHQKTLFKKYGIQ